jgi:hypothetical protein
MNRKALWGPVAGPGLLVASWLFAFFLLGESTLGAIPGDGASAPSSPTASETRTGVAEGTISPDSLYPCRGVWITRTVDADGDVGSYTSLALAPTYPYTPHISYHNVTSNSLKYAWLSGTTWISETVDMRGGQFSSLQLVPTLPYTPCISYYDDELYGGGLKHACRGSPGWITSTVNANHRAGQGGTSLALEPTHPFTPHISYFNPEGTIRTLHHAHLSGTVWVEEWVEPQLSEAGVWSSLALEPIYPYTLHISYHDEANSDLKHSWLDNGAWLSETVDHVGDVGWWTSLALDTGANPYISYFNYTNFDLKVAWLSGTTWLSETVDHTGEGTYWNAGTSLALDGADAPHICYYDAIHEDLKFASSDGTDWISHTVDSQGDVGAYCSLALDPFGCPHITYYDATRGNLKYAYLSPSRVYLPLVTRDFPPLPPYTYESTSLEANCTWTGVRGTVRTADGLPEPHVQLRVGNWQGWRDDTWTDASGQYVYPFADYPLAGNWLVQVFKEGRPASQEVWWETTANCTGGDAWQVFRVDWRQR